MNILTDEDVQNRLEWSQVLGALREAFETRARDPDFFKLPERVAMSVPQGSLLTMPCADTDGWFGVKQVAVVPANPSRNLPSIQAWYTLFDPTGTPALACSATLLTRYRTAAVSAIAAEKLASRLAKRLLVVGTGSLAPWMAAAHAQVKPYQAVEVWGRDGSKAEVTAEEIRGRLESPVTVAKDLAAAVQNAGVISLSTSAKTPIIKGDWLTEGQHIDIVGAFLPDMAEVDAAAVKRAEVFVDDLDACQTEAGDLIQAQAQGWSWDRVYGDLSDVVSGKAGRRSPRDVTLFKSVGLALEDLAVAKLLV